MSEFALDFLSPENKIMLLPEAPEKLWELLETLSRDEEGKFDRTVSEEE